MISRRKLGCWRNSRIATSSHCIHGGLQGWRLVSNTVVVSPSLGPICNCQEVATGERRYAWFCCSKSLRINLENASGSKDVWKEKLSGCVIATTSNLGPWPWYPLFRQYRSVHLAILAMDHKWGTHEPTMFLYFGINPSMVGSNNLDPQNMLYRIYSYIQSPKMIWILDVFYRF